MQDISLTDPPSLIGDTAGELGELFGVGTVGAIPNGHGRGTVLIGTGGPLARLAAALSYALLWRGKVVNAREGRLKNLVTPLAIQAVEAAVYKQDSWHDGKPCIVLDYSKTSIVAHWIRDEIRLVSPNFYLGKVYWGKDRLIDFCLQF